MPVIQTPKTTPIRVPISREVMAQATVLNPNISPHAQMCFHKTQATKLANPTILTRFRTFCKFAKRRQSLHSTPYRISTILWQFSTPKAHFQSSKSSFLRLFLSLQWATATNPRLPIKKRTNTALYSKANDSCANSSFDEFSMLFLCFRLRAWR